jgi:hypothetical protein
MTTIGIENQTWATALPLATLIFRYINYSLFTKAVLINKLEGIVYVIGLIV